MTLAIKSSDMVAGGKAEVGSSCCSLLQAEAASEEKEDQCLLMRWRV